MTLGERIQALRRDRGMSQEDLAEALGVSRQAVSKWEKSLSYPDTGNLLSLAELFGVSADELAGLRRQKTAGEEASAVEPPAVPEPLSMEQETASSPKRRLPRWVPAAAVALAAFLVVMIPVTVHLALRRMETGPVENVPSDTAEADGQPAQGTRPGSEVTGMYALLWERAEGWEYLTVGEQEKPFPFGTTLAPSALETVTDTDFGGITRHRVPCGEVTLTYLHIEEDGGERNTLEAVTTIVPGYEVPRGIQVGSDAQDVLDEYGSALVYLLKESGDAVLCPHDYRYAYAPKGAYGKAILFYITDGHVAGIAVRNADDRGNAAWAVDNVTIFPIVDGQPDFSARREPEREEIDETRTVYIALQALEDDANLSAEEVYRCRQDIYSNLQYMSWQEFGRLGEAGKSDETIFTLLNWLVKQDTLSEDEICGLQAGWYRTDLDGACADPYTTALGRAFIRYPMEYVQILAGEDFAEEEQDQIVGATGYGTDVPEDVHQQAVDAISEVLGNSEMLTEQQLRWAELLGQRILYGYH